MLPILRTASWKEALWMASRSELSPEGQPARAVKLAQRRVLGVARRSYDWRLPRGLERVVKLAQPRQDRSERLAAGQRVLVGGQTRVQLTIQIGKE